jgi:hypothetical protein
VNIRVIPPEEVDYHWAEVAKLLQPVIDISYGEVTLEGIHDRLLSMQEMLLGAFNEDHLTCVCVLGITQFETGKRALQLPYVGGSGIEEWLASGFDVIKDIARKTGCTHIRGCGRAGWGKVLPELKRIRTIYELEI